PRMIESRGSCARLYCSSAFVKRLSEANLERAFESNAGARRGNNRAVDRRDVGIGRIVAVKQVLDCRRKDHVFIELIRHEEIHDVVSWHWWKSRIGWTARDIVRILGCHTQKADSRRQLAIKESEADCAGKRI